MSSKSRLSELGNVILVPLLPVGILLTVALDVALFISDLGFCIPVIEQYAEKYQPFRDMGRALFGTLPTVLLQSIVLTLPVKAASDIGIADIDTFFACAGGCCIAVAQGLCRNFLSCIEGQEQCDHNVLAVISWYIDFEGSFGQQNITVSLPAKAAI